MSIVPLGHVPGGRAEKGPAEEFDELALLCRLDDEELESEVTDGWGAAPGVVLEIDPHVETIVGRWHSSRK